MRVEVYNNFELMDMIYEFDSFTHVKKYRGAGNFKLSLSNLDYVESLEIDNNIVIDSECYIVEDYFKYKDVENKLVFEVNGKHVNSLLDRRVISSVTINTTETYEVQMYNLVKDNFITPADTNRKINNFANNSVKGFAQKAGAPYKLENMSILEALNRIGANAKLGYKINYDIENKRYIFEVYQGTDKMDTVFFSEDFGNVLDSEITKTTSNLKNVVYLNNEGVLTAVGVGIGINRRESIVEGNELGVAYDELSSRIETLTADCEIALTEQFVYKEDWDLGDTVSFIDKTLGFTVEKPILEITEHYTDKLEVEVIFGDRVPTILDQIKGR